MSTSWLRMLADAADPAAEQGRAPPTIDALVVLGDSLSDTGNAGRFCDGPVWVEQLAEALGLRAVASGQGGHNYAVGGARIQGGPNNLRQQADRYLARLGASGIGDRVLHAVYGGGNDLLAAPWTPNRATLAEDAVTTLEGILSDLAGRGARRFLVPNLPDIGMAPQVRGFGPPLTTLARGLVLRFNGALASMLDRFETGQRRQGRPVLLQRLDVLALAERVLADPAAAGFRNVDRPCMGGNCTDSLFWDMLHPTSRAHALLAGAAQELLRRTA